jgi:hypothetical protein
MRGFSRQQFGYTLSSSFISFFLPFFRSLPLLPISLSLQSEEVDYKIRIVYQVSCQITFTKILFVALDRGEITGKVLP